MTAGLDNPEKLRAFFAAKGYRNLVLRVVDMLGMRLPDLDFLCVVALPTSSRSRGETHKQYLLRCANVDGYIVVPWDTLLLHADLAAIERLQAALAEYRSVRYHKCEPMRMDACTTCNHMKLPPHGRRTSCPNCDGTGVTYTWIELSEEEQRLAEKEIHVETGR